MARGFIEEMGDVRDLAHESDSVGVDECLPGLTGRKQLRKPAVLRLALAVDAFQANRSTTCEH
jgi:hypothetical protein